MLSTFCLLNPNMSDEPTFHVFMETTHQVQMAPDHWTKEILQVDGLSGGDPNTNDFNMITSFLHDNIPNVIMQIWCYYSLKFFSIIYINY